MTKTYYVGTPWGHFFLPWDENVSVFTASGDVILDAMRQGKVFEPETIDLAVRYARPGTVAVDLGACFGQYAAILAQAVGPLGRVVAVEAEPFVFSCLLNSMTAQNRQNVVAVNRAAWRESGKLLCFKKPDFVEYKSWGSYGVMPGGEETVLSLALDDLAFDRPVSVIKVDVQGLDLYALQGCEKVIKRDRPAVLFECDLGWMKYWDHTVSDYLKWVNRVGYRVEKTWYDNTNYLCLPR